MSRVVCFPPIARSDARVLILGSMPGRASLAAGAYYAHPRNAFWAVIEARFGISRDLPYAERAAGLRANRVALWDVLEACVRASSLDSDIEEASIVANDFAGFFDAHRSIERVLFNGAKAEQAFQRHVRPRLGEAVDGIQFVRLPSTSPANARLSLAAKIEAWTAALG